jgi:hypothetical protein
MRTIMLRTDDLRTDGNLLREVLKNLRPELDLDRRSDDYVRGALEALLSKSIGDATEWN